MHPLYISIHYNTFGYIAGVHNIYVRSEIERCGRAESRYPCLLGGLPARNECQSRERFKPCGTWLSQCSLIMPCQYVCTCSQRYRYAGDRAVRKQVPIAPITLGSLTRFFFVLFSLDSAVSLPHAGPLRVPNTLPVSDPRGQRVRGEATRRER